MGESIALSAVLRSLGRACDVAMARPYGYSLRVARAALRLAQDLGLPEELQADLLIASVCHAAGAVATSGDLSRVLQRDERHTLRHHPADFVFASLEQAPQAEEDPQERTGIFLRHYVILERFPAWTRGWLSRMGLHRAGEIAAGMFDVFTRAGQEPGVRAASAALGAAYHLVAMRWLAMSDEPSERDLADRALALLEDRAWVQALAGARFPSAVAQLAGDLWEDSSFWEEMDGARTGMWRQAPPPQATPPQDGDLKDRIAETYAFTSNDFGAEVPDIDAAMARLLTPRHGQALSLEQPQVEGWLWLLGAMADRKTCFDESHTARVVNLSSELALLLEVEDGAVRQLRLAAMLYAVGRLALPSAMIETRETLTESQQALVRECPRVLRGILAPMASLRALVEVAASHGERLDGSGGPEGLRGAQISLEARILAVVDTFEALIAERPYRHAHARARALHILQAQSGQLFDGVVTDTLEGVARGEL